VTTKELIKAEIDRLEAEELKELYGLVKRFASGAPKRIEEAKTTIRRERRSGAYIGSPRLTHPSQAGDFVKEVLEEA
jgi:hypothetical protein